ncbi:hypothetical protein [Glaciimonas immobilis]|uniref:Uncharacterized protein n=1 Tax=Glaciimonas immobilis TaxID=728004 RepID=A0A840RWF1_9BURK|nr:hypothetical protein [Glaciimonas immobilis]KAF3997526.1 hypothetical protein HAV38_12670 [Glaciimonas immobilis]MBB5200790.1 hypothetical protein [Glaciimonas immobilis]
MSFVDKYVSSLNSHNLMDDERHHATEALAASAFADSSVDGIGSLLARVKYADGTINKLFEGNNGNLAQLLRIWTKIVIEKGQARQWLKANTAWDMQAAFTLYHRVAESSLAIWLNGGTGDQAGGLEKMRTLEMVNELEDMMQSHSARAAGMLGYSR